MRNVRNPAPPRFRTAFRAVWCIFMCGVALLFCALASGQQAADSARTGGEKPYVLGPGDQVSVQVVDVEEFSGGKLARLDDSGSITVPLAGRVSAGGQTARELETTLTEKLSKYVIRPVVAVSVVERRTHPVTVTGSVKSPGVENVTEGKTLFEVLAQAGGILPEAGYQLRITRRISAGPIPFEGSQKDANGEYFEANIPLKGLDAGSPAGGIPMLAGDIVTVPRAEMIYVIGDVKKTGPIALVDGQSFSVVQAIAVAEGMLKTAASSKASIKRRVGEDKVVDIPVDIDKIMAGKAPDVKLQAKDILVVPGSASKSALERTVTTILAIGTGAALRY